ncbi:MAG: hypothetical protein KAY32_08965 [Candidatus Eisenbacteria sp.]|nr:hypothetical protein [Candidatus Eisenbacteria bacterium]
MTARRWTGLAALLFSSALILGSALARPSPDASPAGGIVVLAGAATADGDSAPPTIKGYRILTPGATVQDTAHIEFLAYWARAESVSADFSRLDLGATAPIRGEYIGDSSLVEHDSLTLWPCFWFTYDLSAGNPLQDGANIAVPMTAVSSYGDTTISDVLRFCLSNDPPRHRGTTIIADPTRILVEEGDSILRVRNGDLIHLETTWHYAISPFTLEADFSAADDSFDAGGVFDYFLEQVDDSVQKRAIYYELDEQAQYEDSTRLPVQLVATDGGCGRTSYTLLLEFDNAGPDGSPVFDELPAETGDPEVIVSGSAPVGSVDLLLVQDLTTQHVLPLYDDEGTPAFRDTLTLQPGRNQLVAYGRDLLGNRSDPSTTQIINLLYAPEFKSWRVIQPDTFAADTTVEVPVQNETTVVVYSYWDDREDYDVWANFSEVDSLFNGAEVLYSRCPNEEVAVGDTTETWACHRIEYCISGDNPYEDAGGLVVPVTAYDPTTGYSTTTNSLLFCLTNHPPIHVATYPVGDSTRYVAHDGDTLFTVRNGGTIVLYTTWRSTNRPLGLTLDLSQLDGRYAWNSLVGRGYVDSLSGPDSVTYWFQYKFRDDACCDEGIDPYDLYAHVTVTDHDGCGTGTVSLRLAMDNEGPAQAPSLVPEPPSEVAGDTLAVSGYASPDDAVDVLLTVEHEGADSTSSYPGLTIAPSGAFSGGVRLLPGVNRLVAYARDVVGNRSPASTEFAIYYVTEAVEITIPKPFYPGDAFELTDAAGWSAVEIEIYNLEGDRIRSFRCEGSVLHFVAQWDGHNGRGTRVRPGPYLVRIRTTRPSGSTQEEIRAFVFQR